MSLLTRVRLVLFFVITLSLDGQVFAQPISDTTKAPKLPSPVLRYLQAQAVLHEQTRDALIGRMRQCLSDRDYFGAFDAMKQVEDELDFVPSKPDLFAEKFLQAGTIGWIGRVQILDCISEDAALVVAKRSTQTHLVIVRGLRELTTVCNDCWIELDQVTIVGSDAYDRVLSELRVERAGDRTEQRSDSVSGELREESTRKGSSSADEEIPDPEPIKSSTRSKFSGEVSSESRRKHIDSQITRILGPTRTILVVRPADLRPYEPAIAGYWQYYRTTESKLIERERQRVFHEVIELQVGYKDGKCRLAVKNTTDHLIERVLVRIIGKPSRNTPVEVKLDQILPGRTRYKRLDWNPKSEPSGQIVSAEMAPAPPCNKCAGTFKTTCLNCLGSKIVKCKTCKGSGKITKRSYRREGDFKIPVSQELDCRRCNGNGKLPCSGCKSTGKVSCKECK